MGLLDNVPLDEEGEPTPCGEPHDDLSGLCGNCHGGDQVDPGVNGPPQDNRYYDGGRLITPPDF